MTDPQASRGRDGPMRGLTFSVVAPTLGLLLMLGLIAWRQCESPGATPDRTSPGATTSSAPEPYEPQSPE